MVLSGCPFDEQTKFMNDYYSIFILPRNKEVHNLKSLEKRAKGFLLLNVEKCVKRRRSTKIIHEDVEHYKKNGIFISTYAKSVLLNDNKVTGLLLDTTWHVMSNYVTSILMASVGNNGIPISFAFDPGETKSLYYLHLDTFKDILGIDLTTYTIESDKGSAIEAVYNENNINHIYCLRHFLASLKYNEFSYSVDLLLKCVSEADFNKAKLTLTDEFKNITDQKKLTKLNKELNKIGLKFSGNEISENDSDLWRRCSMVHRYEFQMPSTTNSLEAYHGHLNKKIPRVNEFWSSIARLANIIIPELSTILYKNKKAKNHN